ncbi:unnamed protein product [Symbiodinium sp. CCMP2456]|nr:unnamed protein product [Symbiodinium sp. CCMP2456]
MDRTKMRLLTLVIVAVAAQEDAPPATSEAKTRRPIISTDILHGTAELFYDVYDSLHSKFLKAHIDKHSATLSASVSGILPDDPIVEVCKKLQCDASQVKDVHKTTQEKALEAWEAVKLKSTELQQQMTTYTHFVVDTFETALPQYAGLIVRTPGNLVLFVLYIAAAVYALVKLALVAFWIFWTLLCCLCCCGCCCLRRKSSKVAEDTSKKNGKASKAAEKGKAATAPAKETNKSNNKKK